MKAINCSVLFLAALAIFAVGATAQKSSPGAGSPHISSARKASAKKSAKTVRKRLPRTPAVDPTQGDNPDGDDLIIRRAAVNALGEQAGTVVVVDPSDGRVLTMVNQ